MQVEEIQVNKEEINKEISAMKTAIEKGLVNKKNPLVKDLLAVLGHIDTWGGSIINVPESFSKAGLTDEGHPQLAIAPADARLCHLYKKQNGGAIFSREAKDWRRDYAVKKMGDVQVPAHTFKWSNLEKQRFRCLCPVIPPRINIQISARILPNYYHLIFEPESWEETPMPVRDPIMGKMLTKNLFGVIATFDLTDLEIEVLKGHL